MTASEHLTELRASLETAVGHATALPHSLPMLAALGDLIGEVDFLQAILAAETAWAEE